MKRLGVGVGVAEEIMGPLCSDLADRRLYVVVSQGLLGDCAICGAAVRVQASRCMACGQSFIARVRIGVVERLTVETVRRHQAFRQPLTAAEKQKAKLAAERWWTRGT